MVAGIGVRPNLQLAEAAGLTLDSGVRRERAAGDERARGSSRPATSPAGPIRTPARGSGWSTGWWRSGRARPPRAAYSASAEPFDAVPFFWSQHYDVPIAYVGHAERWDSIEVDGDIAGRDCAVRYRLGRRVLATATVYRDRESLEVEHRLEMGQGARGETVRAN